jgi:dihydroorotase-like cyclic amidohydrolase
MKTLIKNGRIVTAVDDFMADILIEDESVSVIGKGGLYGNVIRTGMMLNSTKDNVDELVAALDKGFALC